MGRRFEIEGIITAFVIAYLRTRASFMVGGE